ncbi:MAG: asparaginase [Candidatus Methanomethylicota archaeon]|nr:MAG: asparaginase [Candidatus Verstraetearchaeota archaeon]
MKKITPVILIHGGAGSYRNVDEKFLKLRRTYLKNAVLNGFKVLQSKSALDAVESAVKYMENSGVFNAGLGSVLTLNKSVEMDAGIMDGRTLSVGAVGLVKNFKNPISIARKVMDETDHIFIVDGGAEILGNLFNVEKAENLITQEKLERYDKIYALWMSGERRRMEKLRNFIKKRPDLFKTYSTVGAVAIDSDGNVASAVSTGGYWLKFPGRIGDVPLVGCGFYADNEAGAVSATGIGELIARLTLSRFCCDLMRFKISAQKACEIAIDHITRRFGMGNAGVIAVDKYGGWGFAFNTNGMSRAVMAEGFDEPSIAIFKDDPFPKLTVKN